MVYTYQNLNLKPQALDKPLWLLSQYEKTSRALVLTLYFGLNKYVIPEGSIVELHGTKQDGNEINYSSADEEPYITILDENTVQIIASEQMSAIYGTSQYELGINSDRGDKLNSQTFKVFVKKAPYVPDAIISDTDIPAYISLAREQEQKAAEYADDAKQYYEDMAGVVEQYYEQMQALVVNSDWSENDPTNLAHINNRTHYIDENNIIHTLDDKYLSSNVAFQDDLSHMQAVITAAIPTLNSQLENDTGYITKAVNDLVNYYVKSDIYTQAEVNALVSVIPKFAIEVVESLPTEDISSTTIYLLLSGDETDNMYTEYIYVGQWEKLGSQEMDLSGYPKRTELSTVAFTGMYSDLLNAPITVINTNTHPLAPSSFIHLSQGYYYVVNPYSYNVRAQNPDGIAEYTATLSCFGLVKIGGGYHYWADYGVVLSNFYILNDRIRCTGYRAITPLDETLKFTFLPAQAYATGRAISNLQDQINELRALITNS